MDDDSLFLKADTLVDLADTSADRRLIAYRQVRLFKSDLQAVSDSLEYNFTDSTIGFYQNPILWTDSNQITGDTILVFRNADGIEKVQAFNNGFIVEKDVNGLYNQISGKTLDAFFVTGKINRIEVNGSGQSVYYAKEDSTQYSGVNDVVCGKMIIYIDTTNQVRTISFLDQPKATFYPLESFPSSKSRLPGFVWKASIRPKVVDFAK